jgi:hypothetical protein
MNVHRAFLGFFLILAVLALAQQTYVFILFVTPAGWSLGYAGAYLSLWLYGFTIPSDIGFILVQGVYPALLMIAVCIIGLKLIVLGLFR